MPVQAAGHLGTAFDQVAGHAAAGQAMPIVPLPAELVDRRAERQRRVGHATGDHQPGAAGQGFDNRPSPQVGIGADDRPAELGQRLAGVEILEAAAGLLQFVQAADDIVARNHADRHGSQAGPGQNLRAAAAAQAWRIHAAGVSHDPQLRLGLQRGKQRLEHREKIAGVTGRADLSPACRARIDSVSSARYSSVR